MKTIESIQLEQASYELRRVTVGRDRTLDRLLTATLAGGSVALAGPAGVGKRHLAESLARVFGLELTSSIESLRTSQNCLGFYPGVHSGTAEINPAGISTGALVAALRDSSVSGAILTTPSTDPGELPMALRDNILMFVDVPYPSAEEERELVLLDERAVPDRILSPADLFRLRSEAGRLTVADPVVAYAVRLVQASRNPLALGLASLQGLIGTPASPRASIALVQAARGAALLAGRSEVTIDDVYAVAYETLVHRIEPGPAPRERGVTAADIVVEILTRVGA